MPRPDHIEKLSAELRAWSADLEALRPHLDTASSFDVEPAWKAALLQFKIVVRKYAEAVEELGKA